ncbi:MAG: triose-phosphate isomerase [Myxococcales bacterium]|nr:triose-phosphate isomerase [Myxococcales bacterium]
MSNSQTQSRRPLVAGNWKLHKTLGEARELVAALIAELADGALDAAGPEVVVAPVFTALSSVRDALRGSPITHAAQDLHWEATGAFTGEVSAPLLLDLDCAYVIVGHSERRQFFGDSDEAVRKKAAAALQAGLPPIICVGESLEQRQAGDTETHVLGQLRAALEGLDPEALARVVIAYEPIWAIGTGHSASPEDAQAVHAAIRAAVAADHGQALASGMRLLYGGSVKPDNAATLMAQPDIDGALVGGASLDANSFAAIVRAAAIRE